MMDKRNFLWLLGVVRQTEGDFSMNLKQARYICAIAREGRTIIPDGSTAIRAGDKVIIMAKSIFLQELDEILLE